MSEIFDPKMLVGTGEHKRLSVEETIERVYKRLYPPEEEIEDLELDDYIELAEYIEPDEDIEQINTADDQEVDRRKLDDIVMVVLRPSIREMEPEKRRQCCADMEASLSPLYGNQTGQFFNAITSAYRPKEQDPRELGRRIMEKRNPHYQRKNQ